ncbi:MAG: nitroreductase [Acetobacteraceae bacterium]|nr:nitroreductase [Acetobacteraceae bacterium]
MTDAATALESLLHDRWSCRGFLEREVPPATIARLLTMAQRTPSWCNTQPWQVVLTRGEATRRLAAGLYERVATGGADAPDIPFPPAYVGVYRDRRRVCGYQLYGTLGIDRGDRERTAAQARENFRFFGAPHFALITTDRALGPYGILDCGGYVTTFLLAAKSLELGAIPQAAVAAQSPWLRDHLGLPDDRSVVCGISFGYADPAHPANGFRTERAALEDAVQWLE